jgi:NUDIX domain
VTAPKNLEYERMMKSSTWSLKLARQKQQVSSIRRLITASPSSCAVLEQALPDLVARFQKHADKNGGDFPILPPAMTEKLLLRWDPKAHTKRASVLIPLYSDNGVPSILFTARSTHVPLNPSEISFPGGHSLENETLEDTAIREAEEELLGNYSWRDPSQMVILGRGTTVPAITGTPVTPIIAVMTRTIQQPLHHIFPGDKSEVDVVFGISLQELLATEHNHELPNHPLLGKDRVGPRYPSPHGHIWGLTAFMLRPLLHKLFRPVFQLKR